MKILIVSNLYPPHYRGGYEVRCAQVAEALQLAGHEVRVLTTVYGLPLGPGGKFRSSTEILNRVRVDRWLHNFAFGPQQAGRPWTWFQARRELRDARRFLNILDEFRPDVLNWWNMNGISKLLLPLPRTRHVPDVHWIESRWMIDEYGSNGEKVSSFWTSLWEGTWGPTIWRPLFRCIGQRWERCVEREGIPTRAFPNQPSHVCFVSKYLCTLHREAGLEFASSEVLEGGIPVTPFFAPIRSQGTKPGKLRVLFAGQLTKDRGLHTAVEAIGQMPVALRQRLTLSVAGAASDADGEYRQQVVRRVEELGLVGVVTFLGKVAHSDMANTYKDHDLLVFLSTREEGLPLVMVEAMLAGCTVVTTGSGGATEIAELADLPLVPKGDSLALARMLSMYVADRESLAEVAARGQKAALEEYSLERMIGRWQERLQKLRRANRSVALVGDERKKPPDDGLSR
jgi:glycosyltransferase involved in cell wall biosynthesis